MKPGFPSLELNWIVELASGGVASGPIWGLAVSGLSGVWSVY